MTTREAVEQIVASLDWNNLNSLAPRQLADAIEQLVAQREAAVRAEERERAAKIADTEYRRRIGSTIHRRACTEIASAIRRDPAAEGEGR